MHQQFRQAIGCVIVRWKAKLILGQLHYMRATREEADGVSRSHHSDNRWTPSQRSRSTWFKDHTAEGYATMNSLGMDITTACPISGAVGEVGQIGTIGR